MTVLSRPLIGWQTLLADLSLILFMVTAAAQADSGPKSRGNKAAVVAVKPSQHGEALAVYRAGGHAPRLGVWLKEQGNDPRQMLTIMATYAPDTGGEMAAIKAASDMVAESVGAGHRARVIIEPGEQADVYATLAFDVPSQFKQAAR